MSPSLAFMHLLTNAFVSCVIITVGIWRKQIKSPRLGSDLGHRSCEQDCLSISLGIFLSLNLMQLSCSLFPSSFCFIWPLNKNALSCMSGAAVYVCVYIMYKSICVGVVINHVIHHRGKVPLLPQKSEQTASAVAGTHKHTCECLAGGFGGTGHSFLSPTTLQCFIVSYPQGVTCISAPVFLWTPLQCWPWQEGGATVLWMWQRR